MYILDLVTKYLVLIPSFAIFNYPGFRSLTQCIAALNVRRIKQEHQPLILYLLLQVRIERFLCTGRNWL